MFIKWMLVLAVMKLGVFLSEGYKPLTSWALLVAASGLIALIGIMIEEECYWRKRAQR